MHFVRVSFSVSLKYLKILKGFIYDKLKKYFIVQKNGHEWIYISYLVKPLKWTKSSKYFNAHQNLRRMLIIAEVMKELNLSFICSEYNKRIQFKRKYFNYIFGLEPNFERMCSENPKAIKIYFATGCYFQHQNEMIIKRTDYFKKLHKINYPYNRLVESHNSCEIADIIMQIGTNETIKTYPVHLQHKILLVNQTSNDFENFNLNEKKSTYSKTDFIWFGGSGNILKGLDLVIESFLRIKNLNLHIVGPIENEMLQVYKGSIDKSKNIFIYGFLDIDNQLFRRIANLCTFMVFPSASEAGCPGSVANLQKLGVIPIVSKWAAPDNISSLGFKLKNLSVESVIEGLLWSQKLEKDEIDILIDRNHRYSNETHNTNSFRSTFKSHMEYAISLSKT